MRRAQFLSLFVMLAACVTAAAQIAHAQTAAPASSGVDAPARQASVTYVTQSLVYIDAGTRSGLAIGDVLEVLRGDQVITRLEVLEASSHKAACRRQQGEAKIEVGDVVSFRAARAQEPGGSEGEVARASGPETEHREFSRRLRDLGLSGRVGVRYMMSYQPDTDYLYHRPGLDLRLRGKDIADSRIDADVDVRAYRSYRDTGRGSSTDSANRVYRANVAWSPEVVPMRLVLGRQFSPSLANLSLFDGALAEYNAPRFTVGALGGTQPDSGNYGLSTDVHQYGTWAELHNAVGAERRWAGTLGLIGSYDGSKVNRELIYLQGRYDEKRASLFLAQEVDINRSWKRDSGNNALSVTSTHAHGRYRITDALTLSAGVDNRRDVQLYRDYVSPETDFDDEFRSGYWVRIDGRVRWFRAGGDVRLSRSGDSGDANAYSAHIGAVNLTRLHLDLRSRTTRYDGDAADGWLQSFTARLPVGQRVGLALLAGLRDQTSKTANGSDTRVGWYGIDVDVALGHHWLYLLSLEKTEGDDVGAFQLYSGLSYRF